LTESNTAAAGPVRRATGQKGVLASEADKNIANTQARTVSGVFSVTSDLRVEKKG
jgi:hypothetical protein